MRHAHRLPAAFLLAPLAAPVAGCGASIETPHVGYVWTHTPGVAYVVVQPSITERKPYPAAQDPGSGNVVDPRSWYLLLCDARRPDGMHCDVTYEAAVRRFSYTPAVASAAPPMEDDVGVLADVQSVVHAQTATAASGPPMMPPPVPSIVIPPPSPNGGKK
ncbi:MAG TPA: hypothetical protein VGG39_05685 [Polyangiaceae bacterium]